MNQSSEFSKSVPELDSATMKQIEEQDRIIAKLRKAIEKKKEKKRLKKKKLKSSKKVDRNDFSDSDWI